MQRKVLTDNQRIAWKMRFGALLFVLFAIGIGGFFYWLESEVRSWPTVQATITGSRTCIQRISSARRSGTSAVRTCYDIVYSFDGMEHRGSLYDYQLGRRGFFDIDSSSVTSTSIKFGMRNQVPIKVNPADPASYGVNSSWYGLLSFLAIFTIAVVMALGLLIGAHKTAKKA